jgi:predicted pyridoxine 5'-phosphate oxidase superfamily flavin-nucleotide-binding protein
LPYRPHPCSRDTRGGESDDQPVKDDAVTPDEVMFSAAVRDEQTRRGSRASNARRAAKGSFGRELVPDVIAFIGLRDSAYLATSSAEGQPYVQHRGGPRGFLRVLDTRTIAFADFAGSWQYISIGNLAENDRAFLFLMDYEAARRLKLWGRARVVAGDADLVACIATPGYRARIEQAIVFTVRAWDWNCSQHIPRLVPLQQDGNH